MSDFKNIQGELRKAKRNSSEMQRNLFLAKEKLSKHGRAKQSFLRKFEGDGEALTIFEAQEEKLKKRSIGFENKLIELAEVELGLLSDFQVFTDPRNNVEKLSDEYPFLLFPVRLETRFKKTTNVDGTIQHQLWVRVFPDDCSVDTFENILSEAEVKIAQNYWMSIWSAGKSVEENLAPFIQNQKKAAWKALAGNIQSGRAYWITKNYIPINIDELPERISENEIILTIPTENLPNIETQNVLKIYWEAIWKANGKAKASEAALTKLMETSNANDKERAMELIKSYTPYNLKDVAPPKEGDLPSVRVTFIQFEKTQDTETKLASWSQPARITSLPDKFVLMGYKGKDGKGKPIEVLNQLGRNIPDPLIVGPNPSLDTNTVLKNALVEDFLALADKELKEERLAEFYLGFKATIKPEEVKKAKEAEANFIKNFLLLDEAEIIPSLEQIFEDLKDESKAVRYIDYLCKRSETKWLFDFEEAIKVGMAFKVDLSPEVYKAGFDRLFVLGAMLSADEMETKSVLEELIEHHHFGSNGFSIMSQGTATNNTEDENSGFSESEDFEETFERYFSETQVDDPNDVLTRKDGKWLSILLGIDADNASLNLVENYYQTDQREAKAMNTALWSGTIRYFMESMMTPVFNEQDEEVAYSLFTGFIRGRGSIPAIRIGDQPYGILATNTISDQDWLFQEGNKNLLTKSQFNKVIPVLQKISTFLNKVQKDFSKLSTHAAYIGKEGDAHQNLLDALGLHASSVDFHQRYAKSFLHVFNLYLFYQLPPQNNIFNEEGYKASGLDLLEKLGYSHNIKKEDIPILEKFFLSASNQLKGDLIDDRPLSEKTPIRPYTATENEEEKSENYIYWLIENAFTNPDKIKNQQGFADQKPKALLYHMLKHAVELEFSNTALDLFKRADLLNTTQVASAKVGTDFSGIQTGTAAIKNRYNYLNSAENRITDSDNTIAQHISTLLRGNIVTTSTNRLHEVINALQMLKDVPTARLERVFVEHLDCCTYRLDAWLLGFVNLQLTQMRYENENLIEEEDANENYKKGIYIGAYGWVEDLKPDNENLEPLVLRDRKDLKTIFDPKGENEIFIDSQNEGYIHAPSINQAITATVLRNAYISNASAEDPEVYKVNLSSERVRMALGIIEGMQQGQSLAALLGYQLERGLHDRHESAELDAIIYQLRIGFPLNQSEESSINKDDEDVTIQFEERHVINGLALVNHINNATENIDKVYPYGKDLVDGLSDDIKNNITEEVDRIININDALADLATAEGVFQAVQGNLERGASTMETYSKGSFPQTPEVIKTPRSGVGITNRVGIHLDSNSTVPEGATPRVITEPRINNLLEDFIPPLAEIGIQGIYATPTYDKNIDDKEETFVVSIEELGLSHLDLLYILDPGSDKNLTAFDDYILKWIHDNRSPRPDVKVEIKYTETIDISNEQDIKVSVFEITPLIKSLRSLILAGRPLKPTDITLPNEANSGNDLTGSVDENEIISAFNLFKRNFKDSDHEKEIDLVNDDFISLIIDDDFKKTVENKLNIIERIDAYLDKFIIRLHNLSQFGIPQAGFGFIYDRKASIYAAIYKIVLAYKKRWEDKAKKYDLLIGELSPNPPEEELTNEEKLEILRKAERTISTSYTLNIQNPIVYKDSFLDPKKIDFDKKLEKITAFLNNSFVNIKDLIRELNKIKSGDGTVTKALAEFDLLGIETEDDERQIIVLAEDLKIQAVKLNATLVKTSINIQDLLDKVDDASPSKKVSLLSDVAKLLFGEDFKIIPFFKLSSDNASELSNSLNAEDKLLKYQKDVEKSDFPMDDWLYSIARVREKLGHWENAVVLSEGFNKDVKDLSPLQLPFEENDPWLGLSYPESYEIDKDKLLYTAYLNGFDPSEKIYGILIDEWTEVIPAKQETTGLSFQYDQPNAEAPQSMLLVTPSKFTGNWDWMDVVNTMHETLDLAKLRAIEPRHIDQTVYAQFLPATVSEATTFPFITIALNYAINNGLSMQFNTNEDG